MPPSRRSNRGGAFGGSLLAVPNPLPDDDLIPPAEESPTQQEFESDTTVPASLTPAHLPSPALEPTAQEEDDAHPVSALRGSAVGRRPPSTIRIDDKAGLQLFEAFVEAKRQDPFLSYRQFASSIVLDGLNVHHRRQKRA